MDDTDGSELCRYSLKDAGRESGLLIAKIAREAGGTRWGFHALGLPCRGRTYKDSLPQIRNSCNLKTSSLLLRSPTGDLSNFSGGTVRGVPITGTWADKVYTAPCLAVPPEELHAEPKCCTLM